MIVGMTAFVTTAIPRYSSAAVTTSIAEWKVGSGVRAAGMAGAFTGVADDVEANDWNPAGLGSLPGIQLEAAHQSWLGRVNIEHAAGSVAFGSAGTLGMSLGYLSAPGIASDGSSFGNTDVLAALSWGRRVSEGISLGVTTKAAPERLKDTSLVAAAVDLGALARISPMISLGATVQNLGTRSDGSSPPLTLTGGIGVRAAPSLIISSDVVSRLIENHTLWRIGVEWSAFREGSIEMRARAGYALGYDLGGPAGAAIGAGLYFQDYALDLAASPYGMLGTTVQASLSARFGTAPDHGTARPVASETPAKLVRVEAPRPTGVASPVVPDVPVAVFRFANLTGKPANDAFGAKIADALCSEFSVKKGIRLVTIPGTTNDEKKAIDVGGIAGARVVVTGSFDLKGDQLQIQARAFRAEKGKLLDAELESASPKDASPALKRLAEKLAAKITAP